MSSQFNIRIPAAFTKKSKSKTGKTEDATGSQKWARKRLGKTANLMVFDSDDISSKMDESKSKIDSNNVPYAWKSKHAQEHEMVETFTRKQKYKREPIRKFPEKARKPKKVGKIPILSESASVPYLVKTNEGALGGTKDLLARNQSTPYFNTRPKITASSPLGTIMPGKNLEELNNDAEAHQSMKDLKISEKVEEPQLPWSDVVPEFLRLNESQMPLEVFDNDDFIDKTPEQLFQECKEGKSPFFFSGKWSWRQVDILAYDTEAKRFHIKFRGVNPLEKRVKRLDLMFNCEDRSRFLERVTAARAYRERFKEALRLRHYLENVYSCELAPINEKWVSSIEKKAL